VGSNDEHGCDAQVATMRVAMTRVGNVDEGRRDDKGRRRWQGWAWWQGQVATTRVGSDNEGGQQWRGQAMGIIYVFNMIIPTFEFFYLSSCGLVIACRAKWNQMCGKSDIACFSCRLSTFRACTSAHKKIVGILMIFWLYIYCISIYGIYLSYITHNIYTCLFPFRRGAFPYVVGTVVAWPIITS
jgi:hypothetical protein